MIRHRNPALLVVGTLLAAGLASCTGTVADDATGAPAVTEATAGVRVVSPDEAHDLLAEDGVRVLDVRTPEEYAAGHLEGAQLVDYTAPDFADRVAELDRDARWVLYCRSGNRSAGAREVMADLGFTDVADVQGGITAWQAAGLPVVTS